MNGDDGKLVFVSYAHADTGFLDDELMPFLRQLELGEQIELWHDRLIGTGDNWYAEIADRLDHAKVAILLVTPAFLGSNFCRREEVPVLLQRARRGELRVLPLFAEPSLWDNEPWLRRIQMWPTDGKAVSEHDAPARKRLITEFARRVRDAVDTPSERRERDGRFDAPHPTHDLHRMPQTGSLLFGRHDELKSLDTAWDDGATNLVAFTAGGGVGKSTLTRVWAEMLADDEWRGAERAFAWSFYSQGTGRMTDADGFINTALEWFGDDTPEGLSPWDRGERLANCVRRRRTLLILDGVEPLQSRNEGVDRGSIRDLGLRTLLEELAEDNPGLCVVTTRESLVDLLEFGAPAVLHQDLNQVSKLAGRALLRVDRINGDDKALEAAVEDLGGHALAVSLLSTLLTDENPSPHISNAKVLPALSHPVGQGGHPRRLLYAWAKRLGDSAELELLHIIGLFDRPATRSAVQAVIDDAPFRGLNKHLQKTGLDEVLERLRDARLLARQSTHEDTVDAHPIVREHFGQRLEEQDPKSWREGHRRLYEHHKDEAQYQPDDLAGMQPLFAAVVHGCSAGLHQEVRGLVYRDRILRGPEYFLPNMIGAFAADLSCLAHFFVKPWKTPWPTLTLSQQAWVLTNAGCSLRGIGRLREAVTPFEEAANRYSDQADWANASKSLGNLSQLYASLGELGKSLVFAEDAVKYADKSGILFDRITKRANLAESLHYLGKRFDARSLFETAERMYLESQSRYRFLDSYQGYQYCNLLLDEGEIDPVTRRTREFLKWRLDTKPLITIAVEHLSFCRALMATFPTDPATIQLHLRKTVDELRLAGLPNLITEGLLTRAAFHRTQDSLDLAGHDLYEARIIIRRTGMRLYEADLELEQTRWHIANHDPHSARQTLNKARDVIESMNYGRRRPEIKDLQARLE